MSSYRVSERAHIPCETREIILKWVSDQGLKLPSFIASVASGCGKYIGISTVRACLDNRQRTHIRIINSISEITGIVFKRDGDKWLFDYIKKPDQLINLENIKDEITSITYQTGGETVTETRNFKNIKDVQQRLGRISKAKKRLHEIDSAKVTLLAVNGVSVLEYEAVEV